MPSVSSVAGGDDNVASDDMATVRRTRIWGRRRTYLTGREPRTAVEVRGETPKRTRPGLHVKFSRGSFFCAATHCVADITIVGLSDVVY